MEKNPKPTEIKLLQKSRVLEINFDDGKKFLLPCEYLRVYSPSAEVRGHGQGEGVLVTDKQDVNIIGIDPVGNYAVKLIFDDGHASGLYSWNTLYELGIHQTKNWQRYLDRLREVNLSPKPHYEEIITPDLHNIIANLPTKGLLELSARQLAYINVDDDYIHRLFPLIPNKLATKPDYFGAGEMGAHISVIYPEENTTLNSVELQREHAFSVLGFYSAIINQKKYYLLRVDAPTLKALRQRHQLNATPYFKNFSVDLHITVGVQVLD